MRRDTICFERPLYARFEETRCGHVFHRGCLRRWLVRQATCPTCRAAVDVPWAELWRDVRGGLTRLLTRLLRGAAGLCRDACEGLTLLLRAAAVGAAGGAVGVLVWVACGPERDSLDASARMMLPLRGAAAGAAASVTVVGMANIG